MIGPLSVRVRIRGMWRVRAVLRGASVLLTLRMVSIDRVCRWVDAAIARARVMVERDGKWLDLGPPNIHCTPAAE